MGLAQIKECSIRYSKQKALKRKNDMADIRNKLKSWQSAISNYDEARMNTPMDELINEMKDTKLSLDIFFPIWSSGAQTRTRMKWIENGERNDILGIRKIQLQQENNIISQIWKWINTHNKKWNHGYTGRIL